MNATEHKKYQIEEVVIPDKRLGRHVNHDPRNRNFRAAPPAQVDIHSLQHDRHTMSFDQGDLGSCTGNATAGLLDTDPIFKKRRYYQREAVKIYSLATKLDEWDGAYPPDDTGSSGLAAAKAAVQLGWAHSYSWAFGLQEALQALMSFPVMTGVYWYEGFDNPDEIGRVSISGQIRGGHEFEIIGFRTASTNDPILDGTVHAVNSWTRYWGNKGHFFFSARDWGNLLEQDGDVTVINS